jgi:hypothetical protein
MIGSFFRYMFSIRKLNREPEQQELAHLITRRVASLKRPCLNFWSRVSRHVTFGTFASLTHCHWSKCIGAMCTRKRVKWGNFLCLAGVKGLGLKESVPSFGRWPSKKAAESEALA